MSDAWLRQQKRLLFELDFSECAEYLDATITPPAPDELVARGLELLERYRIACATPHVRRMFLTELAAGLLLDEVERYLQRRLPDRRLDASALAELSRRAAKPGKLVPVQTRSGRGERVNAYLARHSCVNIAGARRALAYVGVGYPPVSLAEFACSVTETGARACVIGIEPSIPAEVLHCDGGLVVLFDDAGHVSQVQWTNVGKARYLRILQDWEVNVRRWTETRATLAAGSQAGEADEEPHLVRNAHRAYLERFAIDRHLDLSNVHVVAADFDVPVRDADVMVVMNVLRHYPRSQRRRAVSAMARSLRPNGFIVLGHNAMDGVSFAFLRVLQRSGDRLLERELMFSMNMRSLDRDLGDDSESPDPSCERRVAEDIAASATLAGLDFTGQPYSTDLREPFIDFAHRLRQYGRRAGYEVDMIFTDDSRGQHPTGWLTVRFDHT